VSETGQTEGRRLAAEARDRVRFEEEALALADQVYRVARHLVGSREEADDLMQEAYARAFRSWRSFTPGTNLRAWLLRILTNLNIDRGRKLQRTPDMHSLEANDYFLVDKLEESGGPIRDEERVDERLSQDDIVTTSATSSCSSTSATSPTRTPPRSSTSRSGRSCHVCIEAGVS
jgi:RNA polymerase sigma factor (sigma-70 family)